MRFIGLQNLALQKVGLPNDENQHPKRGILISQGNLGINPWDEDLFNIN